MTGMMAPTRVARPRAVYVALLAITIVAGLASRRPSSGAPPIVAAYAGDTLWATAAFWTAALLVPRARRAWLAASALGVSVTVELSQLYHAPWIDAVRATRAGGLLLGYTFLWSDLACYAVGVALAVGGDMIVWAMTCAAPREKRA